MAFDATVGGADATSYITVEQGDDFATVDIGPERDAWGKADDTTKEVALQRATVELEAYIVPGGVPGTTTQALMFPRAVDVDADGDAIVPMNVRRATYHQAAYVLANHRAIDAANVRRFRSTAGDDLDTFGVDADNGPTLISPRARALLTGYQRTRGGARIKSVLVGTDYSYPRVGYDGAEQIP
jgi:hypothetical protein